MIKIAVSLRGSRYTVSGPRSILTAIEKVFNRRVAVDTERGNGTVVIKAQPPFGKEDLDRVRELGVTAKISN